MGTQHRDIIEINGKKYDAVTGRMIKDGEPAPATSQQSANAGKIIDGFTRRPGTPSQSRQPVSHSKQVQKSQTLMRSAVKKPTPHTKPVSTTDTSKPTNQVHKQATQISPARQHAAHSTQKSPLVSKYGQKTAHSTVIKKVEHLAVKSPAPASAHKTKSQHSAVSAPTTTPTRPRTHKSDAAVQRALAQAKAHHAENVHVPHHARKRKLAHRLGITPRAISISTSVLAVALLAGFFAIQNIPNLSMRVAAARAGIAADMPGYVPTGFGFKGPIQYNTGQVTITFRSNTDDRSYAIKQRESTWNSEALLSNFVVADNKQYQTYIDRGRTLYIYDGSNATWVDDGIWYQVEGDSRMTTDQLVRIAASI